jgi:O-antigen/teichoic acid export membrane protein
MSGRVDVAPTGFGGRLAWLQSSRAGRAVQALGVEYIGTALNILLSLAATPVLLEHLSPSVFGLWIATSQTVLVLNLVDGGSSVYLMLQLSSGARADAERARRLVATTFWTYLALGTIVLALGLSATPFSAGWLSVDAADRASFTWAFVIAVAGAAVYVGLLPTPFGILQGNHRLSWVNAIAQGVTAGSTLFGLVLAVRGSGIIGMAIGQLAAFAVGVAVATVCARRVSPDLRISARYFSREEFRRSLGFTGFFQLSKLSFFLSAFSDAILVAAMVGPAAVTLYVLTQKLAGAATMFVGKLGSAIMPGLAEVLSGNDAEHIGRTVLRLIQVLVRLATVSAALVLFLNQRFVTQWVGPEYYAGFALSLVFAYSVWRNGIVRNAAAVVIASGSMRTWGWLSLVEAVMKIAFALLLLPRLGVLAPAVATVIAELPSAIYLPIRLARTATMSLGSLLRVGVLPPLLWSVPTLLGLWLANVLVPHNWGWFGIGVVALVGIVANVLAFDLAQLSSLARRLRPSASTGI